MPRHYFDFQEGEKIILDDVGLEYPSMEEACHEGLRTLCGMFNEALPTTSRSVTVLVRDGGHKWTRLTVTLAIENGPS